MRRLIIWVSLLTLLLAATAQAAPPAWTWLNPRPQGNDLWSVAYGAGRFVAVGERGSIVTSADGQTWTLAPSPTAAPLRGVIYAAGRFVAVGGQAPASQNSKSDQVILTSTDGQTWSTVQHADGPPLSDVTRGKDTFVAVGGCGWPGIMTGRAVLTSADGVTWQSQSDPKAEGFCGVAYGQDRFVAVAASGRQAVHTSSDGRSWTLTDTTGDDELGASTLRGVAFGGGKFAVVHSNGKVRTSTDGEHWRTGDLIYSGPYPAKMSAANGRFFAPGQNVTSADGVSWPRMAVKGQVKSVGFGAGTYVAVGDGGYITTSADGINWRDGAPQPLPDLNTITYGNGQYLAAGFEGLTLTSPDGANWTVTHRERNVWHGWAAMNFTTSFFVGGRFVALNTNGGKVAVSTDGSEWRTTLYKDGMGGVGGGLIYTGTQFVAGTTAGLFTSADGETWQAVYPEGSFTGVAWDGSRYVAAAVTPDDKPRVLTSADGKSWQTQAPPPHPIDSLAYGGGKFVAVARRVSEQGAEFYLLSSRDGIQWTAGPVVPFRYIHYENGLFLATARQQYYDGGGSDLYTSVDGEHWRLQPTAAPVRGAAFQNGRLMVTGPNGTILASEPVCGTFLDLSAADAACPAVKALVERKVVGGYPDGSFQPDGYATRAELAKMLMLTLGRVPQPGGWLPFTDAAGHWAATGGYLQAALNAGAMNGDPGGTFRPDAPITRAELIKTVLAAAGIKPGGSAGAGYSDVNAGDWYAPWVAAARQAGMIGPAATGGLWTDATLAPDQPAARSEAAQLLQTLLH